jgi:hypothetical protein
MDASFRLVVFGGRDFNDYKLMKNEIEDYIRKRDGMIIVSGTARGADRLGELYATENGFPVEPYPADWNKYGKAAGYIRNEEMAKVANAAIGFWDGKSKGTKHMIDLCSKYGTPIRVVKYGV